MNPKVVAIIPAGGSGRRMQSRNPKQYLLLDGKPVLVHTLLRLQQHSLIDEILLVVPEQDRSFVVENIEKPYRLTKIREVISGGKERQDSVRNGLARVGDDCDIIVVHDGVRPFVAEETLSQVIGAALRFGAAIAGVPVTDTVKQSDGAGNISRTLNREALWLAQTPQAFGRRILQEAYLKAAEEDFHGTDDASLVEHLGIPVKLIPGSYRNIKITTPDDLVLAGAFLKQD
ncbi:MAG: 2-C-methyl-D-erythritol 4-phosphate cytidylyltransferase [Syntrophus sp. PtaU1.Bin005]|jgi:2-C-methyl-D-erythritol 4-phosphate cytidylyltransferase|uniref:2-C-methyl-D-erythritol 4-phosphate cytidylyltransferase n=1 Tax=Syntrophus TaxID=43773 RepID=UPI0009D001F5|nr:MAG: 2-C-methyl-D-erythritol 4-phosphate cytidylyltransferase [Syntrophus sp. PtaB.Bin138]OPY83616.1 MAG: 2-C-methyl-D-erythritol 4-phosphate cytidylyltransferase [Syntrophus sp. PtaU1.Bin005]